MGGVMDSKLDVTVNGKPLSDDEARDFLRDNKRLAARLSFDVWRMKALARLCTWFAVLLGMSKPRSIILRDGFEWHRKD